MTDSAVCTSDQPAEAVVLPGERYSVETPDTLDLAERATFGLSALTGVLDADMRYEQWFHIELGCNPPHMFHETSGRPTCDCKFLESLPYMRLMTGADLRAHAELGLMRGVLEDIGDDGLYYSVYSPDRPWHEGAGAFKFKDGEVARRCNEDFANPAGNARLIMAMNAWYQRDGNPEWIRRMEGIASGLDHIAIEKDDYAYFPESRVGEAFSYPRSGWLNTDEPDSQDVAAEEAWDSNVFMYHGHPIRALCLLYRLNGDTRVLALARRLANFLLQRKYWGVPGEPGILQGTENGHWTCHIPGHASVLRALLDLACTAHDTRLMEFVRRAYEFGRNYDPMGIGYYVWGLGVRCGCSQPRMMATAIALSDAGVGDYWEDVDRIIRNHATATQLLDKERLRAYSQERGGAPTIESPFGTDDGVLDRAFGSFIAYGDVTSTGKELRTAGCCNATCTQGLYFAWESIVRFAEGDARINLLLNRASPWLDIDSYLPYEGKVVIRNKQAKRALVRIPLWVDKRQVQLSVGGTTSSQKWFDRYLVIDDLATGETVEISFPIAETTREYTFLEEPWNAAEFTEAARVDGKLVRKTLTAVLRGNTLVSIGPRVDRGLPLYEREHMRSDTAPMKTVERYVAPRLVRWHT